MRLFIAVNFNESIKNTLSDIIMKLRSHTRQGSFTLSVIYDQGRSKTFNIYLYCAGIC